MKTNKENLGILLRVSSDVQQNEGGGLEVQKRMGLDMSKKMKLNPIIFNEGSQSSFKVEINERVVLVELLDEVQKGTINNIWVFNSDRLGRNTQSWMSIYKVLIENGVKIYVGSSPNPFDLDNPLDNLNMNMLSLISQYDNQLRRMRSVMGKRNSLKSGNTYVGGTKPFGYDVKNKKLIINKEESECVKEIFKRYSEGKSTMSIKTYLDTQTPFQPKRSKSGWNTGTIQKMLGNQLYIGVQKWEWKEMVGGKQKIVDVIEIKTPKVVKVKLWNYVQKILEDNMRNKDNTKKNPTIFDGLLNCKSCEIPLSVKSNRDSEYELYTCRSVEYQWKNPIKWKTKHQNCTLKKSVRVGSTDVKLINHLIQILKESKRVRENYKLKSLTSKLDSVDNIEKNKIKKEKYLLDKKRYKESLEEKIVDTEVQILTSEISKSLGKKVKERIKKLIVGVNEEINDFENELRVLNNSSEWIDWLNQMYLEVDSLEKLPLNKQREFVSKYVKKIEVEYKPKTQSHKFNFKFHYPIVEDGIKLKGKNNRGRKEYEILDGSSSSSIEIRFSNKRIRLSEDEKNNLDKRISELRVGKSLSLNKVCKILNDEGYLTPTKKKWDKPKLSSYTKNMKLDVGKV
jgi:DNA invertase Pin-like site-specific DNA recombinase